jgi:hypothetical protein
MHGRAQTAPERGLVEVVVRHVSFHAIRARPRQMMSFFFITIAYLLACFRSMLAGEG